MPSGKNYKRDYEQEANTESQARKAFRAMRNRARRAYEKEVGRDLSPNMDVDHIKPLSKGGSNESSNLRVIPSKRNRSYPRTRTGRMK